MIANTLGFVLTAVILASSAIWRKSFPEFARYLIGGAMLLLYFSTMRLHFFGGEPLVTSVTVEIILLLLVVAINLLLSIRSGSMFLAAMSMLMGYITALSSPNDHMLFAGILLMTVITVVLALRYAWPALLPTGITFAVFAHFLWSINNPFFGNLAEIRTEPLVNLFFLLAYILVIGIANLRYSNRDDESNMAILTAFFNASLPFIVVLFLTSTTFGDQLSLIQLLTAIVYLGLAITSWQRVSSRYPTFFYTMIGNLALSAAIFQQFAIPDNFLWLCLQSFLVISLAIWFRSRIIVVTNFVIFISIFLSYLVLADTINAISLVFGFVAVFSARIMNWQHDRLELKADMLRNAYLLTALFMFPYALYHLVPPGYVSLSWVGIASFYYLMSKLLNNFKYRWMALATLLIAVIHLMIVGTTSFEPAYRIVSFIVLGLVLLGVSLWYFKSTAKQESADSGKAEATDPPEPAQ
jgi:uncharacterized membrane protein